MATNQTVNNVNIPLPSVISAIAANQREFEWTNNTDFYMLLNSTYRSFYEVWVKIPLQWYDGFVPSVHSGPNALLTSNLATVIVNRCAELIVGDGVMFKNASEPQEIVSKDGKTVGKALDFISNDFALRTNLSAKIVSEITYALAGGFSAFKLNRNKDGDLWIETLRADRFYPDVLGSGELRSIKCVLSFYDYVSGENDKSRYMLIEERRYEEINILGDEIPVVEYKIYDANSPVQHLEVDDNACIHWNDLPKSVRKAFKSEYGTMRLNEPKYMEGFKDLGCYISCASDGIPNVPQIGLGQSILSNVLNYLVEYEFYNTSFMTEMYLARGRVLLPAYMNKATAGGNPGNTLGGNSLDDFTYTKFPSNNPDKFQPTPIQFELRSEQWGKARDIILENIATNIGVSPSSFAPHLQNGVVKTATQVSSETDQTTLFVNSSRKRFESPINQMLKDVLRYYGYIDDVEIRWSKAGMTNMTTLVDVLTKAVNGGLMSKQKAHSLFNFDDDEQQNAEDFAKVKEDEASQQNSLFGSNEGDFE